MPYVRTRLGRLFYEERGESRRPGDPAILLLHGLLFDGGMWRGQIEALSALGRVIIMDGPGHGKSEPPPRFTMEEHADALLVGQTCEHRHPGSELHGEVIGGSEQDQLLEPQVRPLAHAVPEWVGGRPQARPASRR